MTALSQHGRGRGWAVSDPVPGRQPCELRRCVTACRNRSGKIKLGVGRRWLIAILSASQSRPAGMSFARIPQPGGRRPLGGGLLLEDIFPDGEAKLVMIA